MSARLLIFGGEEASDKALRAHLAGGHFDIHHGAYGCRTLAAARRTRPDVIVFNADKKNNPAQMCRQLRGAGDLADIPMVILDAQNGWQARKAGLDGGVDDVLPFPVDKEFLIARLRALARTKVEMEDLRLHLWAGRPREMHLTEENRAHQRKSGGQLVVFAPPDNKQGNKHTLTAGFRGTGWRLVWPDPAMNVVRAARASHPDIILVQLAGEESLNLCGRIRAAAELRGLPLLVLARPEEAGSIARALELGADDYLLWPLEGRETKIRLQLHLRRKRLRNQLRAGIARNVRMAMIDPLTGLHNRHYMRSLLPGIMASAARDGTDLSLLLIDLDRFKEINDTHGHNAGDLVLRRAGMTARTYIRRGDILCRMGGEEFLAILPNTDIEGARALAERLRAAFAAAKSEPAGKVTISIGVSSLHPGETLENFVRRADRAMYRAKQAGRNRVV